MPEPNEWKFKLFSDVGTSEPFVTRITIGLPEILDATFYENRDEISESILGLCMDCLLPAFLSLRELRKIVGNDEIPIVMKTKYCDDMYKSLWTAYKDRMKSTARLMGYDLGFLFQKDLAFEDGCKEFPKAHPEVSHELIIRMKGNRTTWQPDLARFRNEYLEHQKVKREDVAVFYSLEHAELTFRNVWITIEELLVILLATKLSPKMCLREIPEAERNPQVPKRFGFAWTNSPNGP
jgi:hypothetical protein